MQYKSSCSDRLLILSLIPESFLSNYLKSTPLPLKCSGSAPSPLAIHLSPVWLGDRPYAGIHLSDVFFFGSESVLEACPANGLSKCYEERTHDQRFQSMIQTKRLDQLRFLDRMIPHMVILQSKHDVNVLVICWEKRRITINNRRSPI